MIKVENLAKAFPGTLAVDDVSFEVRAGEIVGFLGPNGAGKTTTMRILCGYLAPTSGLVEVAGHDVLRDSRSARRNIGYLPENCPLYPEMRVDDYLFFRGRLKGLSGRHCRQRLSDVKELCGLQGMGHRIIGNLSKGYRQRVGLADALIADPPLLILDEPTIGLDPNQIREVRALIRGLAQQHTVLLSTHILPEVEVTCQRVLIIHCGRIVAADTTRSLIERVSFPRMLVEVQADAGELKDRLLGLSAVKGVEIEPVGHWLRVRIEGHGGMDMRPELWRFLREAGWEVREFYSEKSTLEEVFSSLTEGGKAEPAAVETAI
ncbi:MAG TPA: ATP-binding cassette domain-containing protein [Kiritimatiellae bacterium]|nr:ATP-binding cassette domain-containing protein [Kiritimatiellia bacterium]